MAYQDKILTHNEIPSYKRSRDRWNREYLISDDIAEALNTYRTRGIFPTNNDIGVIQWDKTSRDTLPTETGVPGVQSLFNKYSAVLTGGVSGLDVGLGDGATKQAQNMRLAVTGENGISEFRISNNVPLMDSPRARASLKENSACSVKDLVRASQKGVFGRSVYSYSDFMYCKHLGKMPNNYMITLRRYPIPVTDAMMPVGVSRRNADSAENSSKGAIPVGTMITWMGVSGNNMEDILRYNYTMPFAEQSASWQSVTHLGGGGNQETLLNGIASVMNPAAREAWNNGTKVPAIDNLISRYGLKLGQGVYTKQGDHWDSNKIYGPIDRIKKNYRRSDEGINWEWNFTLNFEYELKSYNGINPKQAMLDLLANILAVTYTNGEFWKGGYYGFEYGTTSQYQNMDIFKRHGSFTGYMNTLTQTLTQGAKAAKDAIAPEQKSSTDSSGNSDGNTLNDYLNNIKSLFSRVGAIDTLWSGLINKLGRPERYAYPSLLSESPVGLWHIVIGNPRRPIMVAGNMIIKNTTITHSGPLGLDDFPESLKVSIDLTRGKPRDIYGIEALYMKGNDRIFHSMSKEVIDMYNSALKYKTGTNSDSGTINIKNILSSNYDSAQDANSATSIQLAANDLITEAFGDPDIDAIIMSSAEQAEGYFNAQDYVEDTETSNGSSSTASKWM